MNRETCRSVDRLVSDGQTRLTRQTELVHSGETRNARCLLHLADSRLLRDRVPHRPLKQYDAFLEACERAAAHAREAGLPYQLQPGLGAAGQISSGQTVSGTLCYEIASDDASSLRLSGVAPVGGPERACLVRAPLEAGDLFPSSGIE